MVCFDYLRRKRYLFKESFSHSAINRVTKSEMVNLKLYLLKKNYKY